MQRFVKESVIHAPPERVFQFHELPNAFAMLQPPWENVEIVQMADVSKVGSRAIIDQTLFGFIKKRWVAEITAYDPPRMFEDIQVSGPFRHWRHRHIVEPHADGSILRDDIEYALPVPIFGPLAASISVIPRLDKMFDFRHRVTKEWCENNLQN